MYVGCWTDVGRTINAQYLGDQTMTTEKCIDLCDGVGYAFAGTEYYYQCCECCPWKASVYRLATLASRAGGLTGGSLRTDTPEKLGQGRRRAMQHPM